MISRLKRLKLIVGCFVIVILINMFFLKINPEEMNDQSIKKFENLLQDILTFSSLATGFLFFIISFIPILVKKNPILKKLGADIKMFDLIICTTLLYFVVSLFCIYYSFSVVVGWSVGIFKTSIFVGLTVSAFFGTILIFIYVLKKVSNELEIKK